MLQHISAVYQISWKDAVQNHELLRTSGETACETLLITFICGESARSLSVASSTLLVSIKTLFIMTHLQPNPGGGCVDNQLKVLPVGLDLAWFCIML